MSDTLLEPEDQMTTTNANTHQNPTVWHDCCKGYDHAPWCFEALKVPGAVTAAISDSDSAHQPAARGEEWRYIETTGSAEIRIGQITLRPHWTGLADGNQIRELFQQIITEHNQYQSLPAEREQMLDALKGVAVMLNTALAKYDKEPWAQRVRVAIAASEQRSTSE